MFYFQPIDAHRGVRGQRKMKWDPPANFQKGVNKNAIKIKPKIAPLIFSPKSINPSSVIFQP
jgi:hypothetical protein